MRNLETKTKKHLKMQKNQQPESVNNTQNSQTSSSATFGFPNNKEFVLTPNPDFDYTGIKVNYNENSLILHRTAQNTAKINRPNLKRTTDILDQINDRLREKSNSQKYLSSEPQEIPVRIISYKNVINNSTNALEQSFTNKPKLTDTKRKQSRRTVRQKLIMGTGLSIIGAVLGISLLQAQQFLPSIRANQAEAAVLSAQDSKLTEQDQKFKNWIETKNFSVFSPKESDLDGDSLNNYEEFLLDTDPLNSNSCNKDKSDMENLLNLVDPKSCKQINLDDETEFQKFNSVINIGEIQEKLIKTINNEKATPAIDTTSLQSIFGIKELKEVDNLSVENLEAESDLKDLKVKYLKLIEKIDEYISKNRSYEIYDRDYEAPVHAAKYLEVSLKYNMPVKYLLAIARAESRFGTDRYTREGRLTRPGEHNNIYSLGLTDSGSNTTFPSWESGVDSMGKWWQKFDQRGVSIQRRLKIFNPNGDYPTKIENLANQINNFINS